MPIPLPAPLEGLDFTARHRTGSLLAHAARAIAGRGFNPQPCPATLPACAPDRGTLCLACAIDQAADAHAGPPTDPVTEHHATWTAWRDHAGTAKTAAALAGGDAAAGRIDLTAGQVVDVLGDLAHQLATPTAPAPGGTT